MTRNRMTYDEWEASQGISPSSPEAYYAELAWKASRAEMHGTIDKLLAHCGDPECMECGAIVCPHGEPLHFHHDGCPSCTLDDDDEQ